MLSNHLLRLNLVYKYALYLRARNRRLEIVQTNSRFNALISRATRPYTKQIDLEASAAFFLADFIDGNFSKFIFDKDYYK